MRFRTTSNLIEGLLITILQPNRDKRGNQENFNLNGKKIKLH